MSDPYDLTAPTTTPILAAKKAQNEVAAQAFAEDQYPMFSMGSAGDVAKAGIATPQPIFSGATPGQGSVFNIAPQGMNPDGLGATVGPSYDRYSASPLSKKWHGDVIPQPQDAIVGVPTSGGTPEGEELMRQAYLDSRTPTPSPSLEGLSRPRSLMGDPNQGLDDTSIENRRSPYMEADMQVAPANKPHGFWGHLLGGLKGAAIGLANMYGGLPGNHPSGLLPGIVDETTGEGAKRRRDEDVARIESSVGKQRAWDISQRQLKLQEDNVAADNKRADAQLALSGRNLDLQERDQQLRIAALSDDRVNQAAKLYWGLNQPIPKGRLTGTGFEDLEGQTPPSDWQTYSNGYGTVIRADQFGHKEVVMQGPDINQRGTSVTSSTDDLGAAAAQKFVDSPEGQKAVDQRRYSLMQQSNADLINVPYDQYKAYRDQLEAAATAVDPLDNRPTPAAKIAQKKLENLMSLEAKAAETARKEVYDSRNREEQGKIVRSRGIGSTPQKGGRWSAPDSAYTQ